MANKPNAYAPGSHTSSVRAHHDALRTEMLSRDEVLAAEIAALQAERDDISEAMLLLSNPAANVVDLKRAAE